MTQVYREWAKKRETNRQKLNSKRMNTRQKSDWNNEEEAVIAFKANWIRTLRTLNKYMAANFVCIQNKHTITSTRKYELWALTDCAAHSLSVSFAIVLQFEQAKDFFSFHSAPFEAKWLFLTFFWNDEYWKSVIFGQKSYKNRSPNMIVCKRAENLECRQTNNFMN